MIRILIIIIILSAIAVGLIITIVSTIDTPTNESPISQPVKKPTFILELLSPSPLPVGRLADNASLVLSSPTAVHTTTIGSSTYAVVASDGDHGIQIIDITNPEMPTPVSSITDNERLVLSGPTAVHTTTIGSNTYAIVASAGDSGIQIIDITNPAMPTPVSSVIDYTGLALEDSYGVHTTIIGSSTYAVVASAEDNGIQIIDITNPEMPTPVSSVIDYATLELEEPTAVHTTIIGSSTYAIVASAGDSGIQIIDITNPVTPTPVSSLTDDFMLELDGAIDVHTTTIDSSTYAVVASNDDSGIQIIDITNPVTPIPVSSLTDYATLELDDAQAVHTTTIGSNTYAIVASAGDSGIQIIDITNPAIPTPVSSLKDNSTLEIEGAWAVHTTTIDSNTYAVVAGFYDDGIEIIQLTQTIPINNSFMSIDDYTTITKNQMTVINVLENDSDDDPLEIISVNSTDTLGHVTIVETQNNTVNDAITFTPLANFEGNTTFTYTVSDGYNSSTSSVHIMVSPQKNENANQPPSTSNSNNIIKLDQSVYSWTDTVHITVMAPSYNLDSSTIDEIGNSTYNPIKVFTKDHTLDRYKLVETGTNTGVFTGIVTLTGFGYNADGDQLTGTPIGHDTNPRTGNFDGQNSVGLGPTNGYLETTHNDMITVSFELSEDETATSSAPIQWSIGQIEWLNNIILTDKGFGTSIFRITDPDMNLDSGYPDDFSVYVRSDSDVVVLLVRETGNATGIFEGTVDYANEETSSTLHLEVSLGQTVTAEYEDYTLPYPQPLFGVLRIEAATIVEMTISPLEDVPTDNLEIKDSLGNYRNDTNGKQALLSADDYITIPKNQTTIINVLENDLGDDGNILKIVSTNTMKTFGRVSIDTIIQNNTVNDTITFTPLANFEGNTTFTYTVSDGYNNSTSSVYVTILPQKVKDTNQSTSISNSDNIIKLDQSVYLWTDTVHITVMAPRYNLDSNVLDEIGDSTYNPIKVFTKNHTLDRYRLVETGVDTGIFTGIVTLTGFKHDTDGDQQTGDSNGHDTFSRTGNQYGRNGVGVGPTNGFLETIHNDTITVSFELSENEIIFDSSPIQWNVGTIEWLDDDTSTSLTGSYRASTIRITDPDMNLEQDHEDDFYVYVRSDSGGIDLIVIETGNATGIFEGTAHFFTESMDGQLVALECDIITAEYEDHTLPYPQTPSDVLFMEATTLVGTPALPLEKVTVVPNSNKIIKLDQSVYSWTDTVHITVMAPSYNLNDSIIDEIGDSIHNPIKVSTKDHTLDRYKLVETGVDTGIFTGQVALTGFKHDADGDQQTGDSNGFDTNPRTGNFCGQNSVGLGPTNGYLETIHNDIITVSFELSEDQIVIDSSPIQWNIGIVEWLDDVTLMNKDNIIDNVLRITDPDMDLNPGHPDNFVVDVWSDSDLDGIDLTVRETGNATGIFEGTAYYDIVEHGNSHRLLVSLGDTVIARYQDHTLPNSLPFDKLRITSTSIIGTYTPPLDIVSIDNLVMTDNFGNITSTIPSGEQAQLYVDFKNNQQSEQPFTYVIQIQDTNDVIVDLRWITGTLKPSQSLNPSVSWTSTVPGVLYGYCLCVGSF